MDKDSMDKHYDEYTTKLSQQLVETIRASFDTPESYRPGEASDAKRVKI